MLSLCLPRKLSHFNHQAEGSRDSTPEEMKIAAELMAMAHGRVTTPEPAKTARKAKRSPELERAIASILEKVLAQFAIEGSAAIVPTMLALSSLPSV